jgi:hypothetical protein
MWENADYGGIFWYYSGTNYNYNHYYYVGAEFNDEASSLYNDRSSGSIVDKDYPPGDDEICAIAQDVFENLAGWEWPQDDTTMNDSISSFNLTTSANC